MALTKVRPPVTDISNVSFGTTVIDIPSTGADIDIDVAGLDVIDLGQTTISLDALVTLIAAKITSEQIDLATSGGAAATLKTDATTGSLITAGLFNLLLGSNSLNNLICQTDGRVALNLTGNLNGQLVDKNYVDTQVSGSGATPSASLANPGHVKITTSDGGGSFIVNWGSNPAVGDSTDTQVTFDLPFPNAFFVGFAGSTTLANHDGTMSVIANSLTTMNIWSSLDKTSTFDWLAIGF